jgi:hypothetical protein
MVVRKGLEKGGAEKKGEGSAGKQDMVVRKGLEKGGAEKQDMLVRKGPEKGGAKKKGGGSEQQYFDPREEDPEWSRSDAEETIKYLRSENQKCEVRVLLCVLKPYFH